MTDPKKIVLMTADDFKAARSRLGLSQHDMADQLRVDVRTVRRWEAGHVPIGGPASVAVELLVKQHDALVRRLQRDFRKG